MKVTYFSSGIVGSSLIARGAIIETASETIYVPMNVCTQESLEERIAKIKHDLAMNAYKTGLPLRDLIPKYMRQ